MGRKPDPTVPEGYRRCCICKEIKLATPEYFTRDPSKRFGVSYRCLPCAKEKMSERYRKNPEKLREWRRNNPDKVKSHRNKYLSNNSDKLNEQSRLLRAKNPEKYRQKVRDYRLNHLDADRERQKRYPEKKQRYRARKRSLPVDFTPLDWKVALDAFGNCCAVCSASFEHTKPHQDHWIPLSSPDCPGTVPHNMVPLCGHCNRKKNRKMPKPWLTEKYGEHAADNLLKQINDYLESVRR